MRIILIGYMGSGKSTMGRKISRILDIPFIDSDQEISVLSGKSIPELFEALGEEGFRQLDKSFIESLSKEKSFVLSTGGGLPCFNNLIDDLNALGVTIYLSHPPKELVHRLIRSKTKRPIIEGKTEEELIAFVQTHLGNRLPYYSKAQFIAPRSIKTATELIEMIGIKLPNK
jgi:shikimate kinase